MNPITGSLKTVISFMVQQVDYRWNHLESGLRLIQSKLEQLGLVFMSGEVVYLCEVEEGDA